MPKSPIDFAKLEADLRTARAAADALPFEGDGGSCNHDACALSLPHQRAEKVREVVRRAGLSAIVVFRFGIRQFLIQPHRGQGDHRTKCAEAMIASLRVRGWDVSMHSRAD